jgi:hypothetical protein
LGFLKQKYGVLTMRNRDWTIKMVI